MSLSFLSAFNSPPLVASAGAAILIGLPTLELTTASLTVLKGANALAFVTNLVAVSVPGRLDGPQDHAMRGGNLNPSKPASSSSSSSTSENAPLVNPPPRTRREQETLYSTIRTRTLLNPSGWAFSIWGPIYLGETAFVTAQLLAQPGSGLATVLPQLTAPFVAFNLMQSLWCASFRPSYSEGWYKWVSVAMLGGTAYSLFFVQAIAATAAATTTATSIPWWYFLPMTIHFGWTTAATLVNLNGSVAMSRRVNDSTGVAVGHASAVTATVLGALLAPAAPAYGLTVAWALAACADGMTQRLADPQSQQSTAPSLQTSAGVQRMLCWAGSVACVGAAAWPLFV